MRDGSFREDLLFRLNVVNLKILPLRERPADVIELAQHFIKKYSDANGAMARPLSAEARRTLVLNRRRGNVRELENTIHRAVLLATGFRKLHAQPCHLVLRNQNDGVVGLELVGNAWRSRSFTIAVESLREKERSVNSGVICAPLPAS